MDLPLPIDTVIAFDVGMYTQGLVILVMTGALNETSVVITLLYKSPPTVPIVTLYLHCPFAKSKMVLFPVLPEFRIQKANELPVEPVVTTGKFTYCPDAVSNDPLVTSEL